MEKIIIPIAFTMLIFSALITSCRMNTQSSTAAVQQNKYEYDSIIINRPEEKNRAVASKNNAPQEETIVTTVPAPVKANFKATHTSVTDVVWAKETSVKKDETTYKVNFVSNHKSNWVIYSERGDVIEEQQQIDPDQLPQNIRKAIKQKYPDSDIVLSTTYKHVKQEGSYYVLIVSPQSAEKKEIELILRENGTFVQ